MAITIRPAVAADSTALTEIAFAAKRHWRYPREYLAAWQAELTVTPDYIGDNLVYVAADNGRPIGFFSIVHVADDFWAGEVFVAKGVWLDHMFLRPEYIGQGIGSRLVAVIRNVCRERSVSEVLIFSDPHAKGFYEKLGAEYQGESPSSIAGRTVPKYRLKIK